MTAATLTAPPLQYRLLARLLDYPDPELAAHLDQAEALLADLPDGARRAIGGFLTWARRQHLTDWQAHYVRTFDLTPDTSLHLTWHLFEEQDRQRGITLANLAEFYKKQGLEIDRGELPDFLPLILEYASTLPQGQGTMFLHQCRQALEVLAQNLARAESPYAPLVQLLIHPEGGNP